MSVQQKWRRQRRLEKAQSTENHVRALSGKASALSTPRSEVQAFFFILFEFASGIRSLDTSQSEAESLQGQLYSGCMYYIDY
jgi:hypothetical protein